MTDGGETSSIYVTLKRLGLDTEEEYNTLRQTSTFFPNVRVANHDRKQDTR